MFKYLYIRRTLVLYTGCQPGWVSNFRRTTKELIQKYASISNMGNGHHLKLGGQASVSHSVVPNEAGEKAGAVQAGVVE